MVSVYSALFLSLRKAVTFSTYRMRTAKSIIFCRRAPKSCRYFDLETGHTNLPETVLKRYDYGFIQEIIGNPGLDYFKQYECELKRHGCAEATALPLFKLMWDLRHDRYSLTNLTSPHELLKALNELLSVDVPDRTDLDERLLQILIQILEKRIPLNDIINEKLAALPAKSRSRTLRSLCTAYVYQIVRANHETHV